MVDEWVFPGATPSIVAIAHFKSIFQPKPCGRCDQFQTIYVDLNSHWIIDDSLNQYNVYSTIAFECQFINSWISLSGRFDTIPKNVKYCWTVLGWTNTAKAQWCCCYLSHSQCNDIGISWIAGQMYALYQFMYRYNIACLSGNMLINRKLPEYHCQCFNWENNFSRIWAFANCIVDELILPLTNGIHTHKPCRIYPHIFPYVYRQYFTFNSSARI